MNMLGLFFTLAMAPQEPTSSHAGEHVMEDVVVTASREPPRPYDVVADFVAYCYDANRLAGRARSPEGIGLWAALDRGEASRLGVSSTGQGYILDSERIKLLLLIEEGRGSQDRRRHTCTLTAVGGHDPKMIESDLARLMGRGGSSGYPAHADPFPALRGWRQIGWSAIPRRGSRDWQVFGDHPESFVVAVQPHFYSRSTWVVTELLSRENDGAPTTTIKLTHFFKP
jgi:hypothetical protein